MTSPLTQNINTNENKIEMENENVNDNENDSDNIPYFYDINGELTFIEKIFGEPYHINDDYFSHQITYKLIFTVISVYIVEGAADWLWLGVRYYLIETYNIGPSKSAKISGILFLPWSFKLLYALFIDRVSIFNSNRKSYMIILGIFNSLTAFFGLFFISVNLVATVVLFSLNQLFVSSCDLIADALTVERTEFKNHKVASRLQMLGWGSRYISSIIGLLFTTRIERGDDPQGSIATVFIYCFITILIPVFALYLPDKTMTTCFSKNKNNKFIKSHNYSIKEILYLTFETLCYKKVFYPFLFMTLLCMTPTSSEAMDYFLMYKLNFDSIQIGYLKIAGGFAFLLSLFFIYLSSRKNSFNMRRTFIIWTILAGLVPFLSLILIFGLNEKIHIPNFVFMLTDNILFKVCADMILMCVLILTARLCPPKIEAVFTTVFTSFQNFGYFVSLQLSSFMTKKLGIICNESTVDVNKVDCNFDNLWILIIIVNISTFIPLILIYSVPNEKEFELINDKILNKSKENNDSIKNNDNNKYINSNDMIKIYYLCIHYVFPFFQSISRVCCGYCKNGNNIVKRNGYQKHNDNLNENDMDNDINNNINQIEMR